MNFTKPEKIALLCFPGAALVAATGWFAAGWIRARRDAAKARARFRNYLEPIIGGFAQEDPCKLQLRWARQPLVERKAFVEERHAVRPHLRGNAELFDQACDHCTDVTFGEYGGRAKNEEAKNELLQRMRNVLSFVQ